MERGFRAKSDYVTRPLNAAGRAAMITAIERRSVQPGSGALLLDSCSDRYARIPLD